MTRITQPTTVVRRDDVIAGAAPDPTSVLSVTVALVSVALVGLDLRLALGVTTATVASVALAVTWFRQVRRFAGASVVVVLSAGALLSGFVMSLTAGPERLTTSQGMIRDTMLLVTTVAVVGLLLWIRQVLPLWAIGTVYGVAALVGTLPYLSSSLNPWKFLLSIPVTILALSLAQRRSGPTREVLQLVALAVLAAVGFVLDSRSFAGLCLLTVGLVLVQRLLGGSKAPRRGWTVAAVIALVAAAGYQLLTTALVGGFLGEESQERTLSQVERAGSLLAGGRPEWSATVRLMLDHPQGYGIGVEPTAQDVLIAKQGLESVGVETTNNGYVERYMFGGGFEVHSVIGDFWARYTVVGLVLALVVGALLLRYLVTSIASRSANPLVVFLAVNALWFLMFGPMGSPDLPVIALALGLALSPRPGVAVRGS